VTSQTSGRNIRSVAREFALQFLYQAECEKLFFHSDARLHTFVENFSVPEKAVDYLATLVKGAIDNIGDLDQKLAGFSENWSISRMSVTDRSILRIALFELQFTDTPPKVVMNEAIDLAKKYGSAHSGGFVNGVIDKIAKQL